MINVVSNLSESVAEHTIKREYTSYKVADL